MRTLEILRGGNVECNVRGDESIDEAVWIGLAARLVENLDRWQTQRPLDLDLAQSQRASHKRQHASRPRWRCSERASDAGAQDSSERPDRNVGL